MEERIQLNIQLPLEELSRFSRLVDQLQQMMTAADTFGNQKHEAEGSPSFDLDRFQELMMRETASQERTSVMDNTPQTAAYEPGDLPPAPRAASELSYAAEVPTVQAEVSPLAEAPSAQGDVSPLAGPPAVEGEISASPEISSAQIEEALQDIDIPTALPDQNQSSPDLPDQNQGSSQAEEEISPPPDNTSESHMSSELATPVAGYYPEVQLPEPPGGTWSGVHEELAFSGPAPLTAEAVSLAFQRDDRRYDNGFPLY